MGSAVVLQGTLHFYLWPKWGQVSGQQEQEKKLLISYQAAEVCNTSVPQGIANEQL